MSATLVLKRKQFSASRRERRITTALLVVFAVAFGVVFYPLFEGVEWSKAPGKLVPAAGLLIEVLGALLIGFGLIWYTGRAKKLERLTLDERGMRYQSPLPDWLASMQPSWSHSWAQITAARIVMPRLAFHPNMVALVIEAGAERRKLPAMWVAAEREDDSEASGVALFSSHQAAAQQITRDVDQSALVQHMRRMGVKVERHEAPRAGFALERNRASLGALMLIFALIAYAIVDFMVNTETYAVKPPAVLYVLAGALVMLACAITLALKEVPSAEAWGVSVVLGAAFAAALYPGLLRVNQVSDQEGLKPQQYRLDDYVLFKALDPRLPDLVFIDDHEYWQQFPRGSQHEFLLRKGALGFHQVDMGPVHARMRKFYLGERQAVRSPAPFPRKGS